VKILLLTQFCNPEPAFKSVPFARELVSRGHEVRILTGFPNYPKGRLYAGYRLRWRQREVIDGIPVLRVPLYPSHDASSVGRAINYLSFFATAAGPLWFGWKPDVVYIYNLVTLGALSAVNRAMRKVPCVLDVQDLWPDSIFNARMGASWLRRPVEALCRIAYRGASKIVVLSPGFRRVLVERGVPEEKIEVIYNWCDEDELAVGSNTAGDSPELGQGWFNIVFAGNLGLVQGLEAVIEAATLVEKAPKRIRFVFMGQGVMLQRLKELAAQRAPKNTLFLPARPFSEAVPVLRQADALLVHLQDSLLFSVTIPSKTQAYLALGRPILVAMKGDAAALVQRAAAGLSAEPGNPASIAQAAMQLAETDPAQLNAMGRKGADFYGRELSFAAGVTRFEQVFRSVVSTSQAK
jgi:glycosyltransferase involved in cell wall biosynthesis